MREPGYYWVKGWVKHLPWRIAEWNGDVWIHHGDEDLYKDRDFSEIDERRITRLTEEQHDVLREADCDHDWRGNDGYAVCIKCNKREAVEGDN